MAYFPDNMPKPIPTMDDAGFWAACRDRRLRFQACADCATPRHPPTPVCPVCHSLRTTWVDAPDDAEVFTYTVVHHASHAAVGGRLPYVGAVVVFPSMPGVRLVSNVTDCDPASVRICMELELWWDDVGEGQLVPRFRPRGGSR